jgi:hypothetical protein
MRKYTALFVFFILSVFQAYAQTQNVSQLLYRFSPLGLIIANNFGLEDKNGNGVIDRGAGEGYEGFITKYGNADVGFHANGVIFGANNGRLEENEVVNHYYINIRFKQEFERETSAIESEVKAYIYANNIPLVWLDDEQGTVMNAVNKILGAGWNEQKVSEDKAVEMLNRTLRGLGIEGRTGMPGKDDSYYTLSEFVKEKSGYCTEVAQFGFWFFSELKINSSPVWTTLTYYDLHEVIQLSTGRIVDFFGSSIWYDILKDNWYTLNPFQSIGEHYQIKGEKFDNQAMLEQAVLYNKYSIESIGSLMEFYFNNNRNYKSTIDLGNFFLQNNDLKKILNAKEIRTEYFQNPIKMTLIILLVSYYQTRDKSGNGRIVSLLNEHYPNDIEAEEWINDYKL